MSEDVTAVSMQVSEKAAEAALSAFKSVLDSVGRLFRELLGMEHDRARANAQMKAAKGGAQAPDKTKPPNVSATNLTGIKPGEVSMKDLAENARNTGEAISIAQNGFSQEDRRAIARTAKKYGIPVAFTNTKGKNNLYANVRSGDLPIFRQICTECVKEKIAVQPETLGNFKVQPWEVPHLTAMLKSHDLPAVFVETKNGDQYCLHDVKHQDAVRIVREEFVAKCRDVEKGFSFDKDENGFYTLKDLHSGREVSFDQISDKATVSQQIQTQFGYDPVKADLAASKFGEEALKGRLKERYFSGSAQNEFSLIEANVTLEGENLYTEDVSVSGTETYADHTRYYGVPDEEIVSCDLGTASKPREEDDADEEAEIPAAVMDEDGEAVTEPDTEPDDADEIPYYGEPDEEPSRLEDLTGVELEVKLQSVEIYASNTEKAGEPDDLTGFSFDIMN